MSSLRQQNEPTELDNDLEERILSIINDLELARMALLGNRHELIATALENGFGKYQLLIDDYCIVED